MAEAAKKKAPAKKTTKKATTAKNTSATKAAAKKPAAKKPAVKKTVAKKPTAKKSAVKKPTVKKAAAKKATTKTAAAKATKNDDVRVEDVETQSSTSDTSEPGTSSFSSQTGFDSDRLIAELKEKDWGTIAARAFFMVFFGLLANVALIITFVLALVQFVLMVGTGSPNRGVTAVVSRLATYIGQALDFLSFRTEDKPFPMDLDLPEDS